MSALSEDAYRSVLETVDHRTDADDPMVSKATVRQRLGHRDISSNDANRTIEAAIQRGDLWHWQGYVALADVERLRDVVRDEAESDCPRKSLIAKANTRIQELQEGER